MAPNAHAMHNGRRPATRRQRQPKHKRNCKPYSPESTSSRCTRAPSLSPWHANNLAYSKSARNERHGVSAEQ